MRNNLLFITILILLALGLLTGCATSTSKAKKDTVNHSSNKTKTDTVSQSTTVTNALDTTLPGSITLKWRTESEQDNYGFNLFRSLSEQGPWEKVNDKVIPGHGTTSEPHDYSYIDTGVRKNTRYYYQIEYVDMAGNIERKPYTIKGIDNKPVGKEK